MNEPERTYDRIGEVSLELWEIEREDAAEKTIIGDEEFDNREWLEAEREALMEKQKRIEETVTISGEFAGLKKGDA